MRACYLRVRVRACTARLSQIECGALACGPPTLHQVSLTLSVCVQYYISVFPSAASVERGTAIDRKNMLRRLCQMARITIMRCKHDAALERDVLGLVPGIHTTLDTSCPGVRMRGTEAWVAAFSVLGPRLRPYMENLTQTQQRLVNLYFKRIRPASMAESVAALSAPQ